MFSVCFVDVGVTSDSYNQRRCPQGPTVFTQHLAPLFNLSLLESNLTPSIFHMYRWFTFECQVYLFSIRKKSFSPFRNSLVYHSKSDDKQVSVFQLHTLNIIVVHKLTRGGRHNSHCASEKMLSSDFILMVNFNRVFS